MAEYITLVGVEDIRTASNRMHEAADTMNRATGNLEDVFVRARYSGEEFLTRLETILSEDRKKRGLPE